MYVLLFSYDLAWSVVNLVLRKTTVREWRRMRDRHRLGVGRSCSSAKPDGNGNHIGLWLTVAYCILCTVFLTSSWRSPEITYLVVLKNINHADDARTRKGAYHG